MRLQNTTYSKISILYIHIYTKLHRISNFNQQTYISILVLPHKMMSFIKESYFTNHLSHYE